MNLEETIIILLEEKKYNEIKNLLIESNVFDIAEILNDIDEANMLLLFRLLPKDLATEVFSEVDSDMQSYIINSITDSEIKYIIDKLFIDDTVDLIEELPANIVKIVLKNISQEKRKIINQFLIYPEDSAGSIMTIEFLDLKKEMSVAQSIDRIKKIGVNKETVNECYVISKSRRLEGVVTLKDIVLSDNSFLISKIMEEDVLSVHTSEDIADIAYMFKKYDVLSMPVVDNESRLVGIITIDDIIDVIEEETSEDIEKMAAIMPLDESYMKASVFSLAKKRMVWLLLLMITATISQAILKNNENFLSQFVVLTAFIPMLMGAGGNAGSQASTLIIRGIALNEIELSDFLVIIFKEARVALLSGLVLAIVNFIKLYLIENISFEVSLTVSLSLICTILVAKLAGGSLPLLAKILKIDPALMAAPLITTILDAVTVLIYLSIAKLLLGF
ncbi:MAG: magnesium transporter [Clostridiales bacterium]|nr:magnesium transporter [Clostridiales bacterium]